MDDAIIDPLALTKRDDLGHRAVRLEQTTQVLSDAILIAGNSE